jgi:hypothetical protein
MEKLLRYSRRHTRYYSRATTCEIGRLVGDVGRRKSHSVVEGQPDEPSGLERATRTDWIQGNIGRWSNSCCHTGWEAVIPEVEQRLAE